MKSWENLEADENLILSTHMTKDGVRGISLARLAAAEIGLSIDLERFYRSMLAEHRLDRRELVNAFRL